MTVSHKDHVTLATVTYGQRLALLEQTLRHAFAAGVDRAVVVSNGCDDAVVEAIEDLARTSDDIGPVDIVRLATNTGSAGGFAVALREAAKARPDGLVWVLDDDNWPAADALDLALASLADLEARFGVDKVAVSSFRSYVLGHAKLAEGAAVADCYPAAGACANFDLRSYLHRGPGDARKGWLDDHLVQVPMAPYGGLLFRASTVREHGLPREDYVLYVDDHEYTNRLSRAGVRLFLDTRSTITEGETPTEPTPTDPAPTDPAPTDTDAAHPEPAHAGEAVAEEPGSDVRPFVRMLRTPKAEQGILYYQFRNEVNLSRSMARSPLQRAWFVANTAAYLAAIAMAAGKPENRVAVPATLAAMRDGLLGRLGRRRPLMDRETELAR